MNEIGIVQPVLFALLRQNGIVGTWKQRQDEIDGELTLELPDKTAHFFIEVKRELRTQHLPQILVLAKRYGPLVVIAERIFPNLKQTLREEKIGYIDAAGNIFAHTPDIYIWIDGHKPFLADKPGPTRAFTKTGLKMVFHLLQNAYAVNAPYRQLAADAGIALGAVKNVMDGLRQNGFLLDIDRNTVKLQNKPVLLERWITGYRETLKPALNLGTYRFTDPERAGDWQKLPLDPAQDAWGGEPAADYYTNYLKPGVLTLYTKQPKIDLMIKWRLIPDPQGNLLLFEKFWKDEPIHAPNNSIVAPPLLVYTDLLLTEDPRCNETAQRIYNELLRNEFE